MKKISFLSTVCALSVLSACDHYSTRMAAIEPPNQSIYKIEPAAGGAIMSNVSYSQILANEYYNLARHEQEEMYDYKAAKYYLTKAEKLNQGQMVSPAKLSDFEVGSAQSQELSDARINLISALKTYNIPENRHGLAMAQTRFDCWVEQYAETRNEEAAMRCKNDFLQSLASLTPPNYDITTISVPFGQGSMALSEQAQESVGQALSLWRDNPSAHYTVTLQPASAVTLEEAERQISMVRSILQYNGIPASSILTKPAGGADNFVIEMKKPIEEAKTESSI